MHEYGIEYISPFHRFRLIKKEPLWHRASQLGETVNINKSDTLIISLPVCKFSIRYCRRRLEKKQRQRSSRLFGGQKLFNSLLRCCAGCFASVYLREKDEFLLLFPSIYAIFCLQTSCRNRDPNRRRHFVIHRYFSPVVRRTVFPRLRTGGGGIRYRTDRSGINVVVRVSGHRFLVQNNGCQLAHGT